MTARSAVISLFLFSAMVAMSMPAQSDWVDRMAAARGAADLGQADWVDRMAAARATDSPPVLAAADPREAQDWIDRLVADRGRDYAVTRILTALAEPR